MTANTADYIYLAFAIVMLFLGILHATIKMKGGDGLILPLKRIIYNIFHGKKVHPIKFQVGVNKVKVTKWYQKENCKCFECLSKESKDCFTNCLPATGFSYTEMPCKSCEFRSWCYTKHE